MIYYRLKAFCRSRLGQMTLFTLAVVGLFVFLAGKFERRKHAKEETGTRLPNLPQETLWMDPQQPRVTPENSASVDFTLTERNETFRPFRPSAPKLRLQEPIPRREPSAQADKKVFPLPSLIQFERARKEPPHNQPVLLSKPNQEEAEPPALNVEEGALLFCELTVPVDSDATDAPVLASLTRPLIRGGKVVLPRATSLSGSLQRAHGNRLFLASDWRVELPSGQWASFQAHAQETAIDHETGHYAANDGCAGLPALVMPKPRQSNRRQWARSLGTIATAAARLGKDRARTALGEYIPGTSRNVILEGASNMVVHYTNRSANDGSEHQQTVLSAQAGQPFYLLVLP